MAIADAAVRHKLGPGILVMFMECAVFFVADCARVTHVILSNRPTTNNTLSKLVIGTADALHGHQYESPLIGLTDMAFFSYRIFTSTFTLRKAQVRTSSLQQHQPAS